ncbi:MAG TPA: lysine--tRNA ligase [Candidatus Aminicenantes bacterium]|nr:lysine--tRNA ligase [Candidatus Aminicenantes bacterium]
MEEQFAVRQEKLKKLEALGVVPYPYRYEVSQRFAEVIAAHRERDAEQLQRDAAAVRVAGRVVAIRSMGKSVFMHLFDGSDRLQVYVRKDGVGERDWAVTGLLDIGDIVGAAGTVFKTRTGELSVLVQELAFLAKSFHPLPEKWHGLQDKELRFRQRYLDMIVNPEATEVFRKRSRLIQAVRRFFHQRGYVEVETPMMHPIPGGASARPFVTHHNALDIDLYLRVAPELYLKRLLVGGMEKVFEINRNFRNEGISLMHNPEFTMIEFYELYRDFNDYMDLSEQLLLDLAGELLPDAVLRWQGKEIPLTPPFRRVKYMDAIAEKSGLAPEELWDEAAVRGHIAQALPNEPLPPTYGKMLDLLFSHYVEDGLDEPTFVTYFPKAISPLSKASRLDERETERFELYIAGMEIANGFSELNDPLEQRRRFEAQARDRERGDDEAQLIDNGFLTALEHGMAPAAGEGIGIDRLVMLFTGAASIKDVILFPLLRPKE